MRLRMSSSGSGTAEKDGAGHWHHGNLTDDGAEAEVWKSNATMPVPGTV